jgi:hypothetical protein
LKQGTKGKRKETELRREMQICGTKEKNTTKINCCCALFPLLQVSVTFTAGGGRQGRRRRSRSTGFRSSSAAAREPTRRQWRRRVEQRATTVQTTPRLCSTVPEDFFVFLL